MLIDSPIQGRLLLHDVRQADRGRLQGQARPQPDRREGADLARVCHVPAQHAGHKVRRALDAHVDAVLPVHHQVGGLSS